MAEKDIFLKDGYENLSLDEINDVAGGLRLKDLTPEEKAKMRKLHDEFYYKKMSGSPASEEYKRYSDYVEMLEKKYGTADRLDAAWGTRYGTWEAFLAATNVPNEKLCGSDRFICDPDTVGTKIGDHTDGTLALDIHAFV